MRDVAFMSTPALPHLPSDARQAILASYIRQEVARGGVVAYADPATAVVHHPHPVNHVLHLILTILTFWALGGWGWVWLLAGVTASAKRKTVTLAVDPWGHVSRNGLTTSSGSNSDPRQTGPPTNPFAPPAS